MKFYILLISMLLANITHAQLIIENPQLIIDLENVLRATISFNTNKPTKALIVLYSDEHTVTVRSTQSLTDQHQIEIIGLHPQEKYTTTIAVVDIKGDTAYDHSLQLQTNKLPDDFPSMRVILSNPDKMQPGITFFDVKRWLPVRDGKWGKIIGVDEQGKVVWYHEEKFRVRAVSQMQNQNLIYLADDNGRVIELDMLGNKKNIWSSKELVPPIEEKFHHDAIEMSTGNLLALSRETKTIDGYTDKNGQQITKDIRSDVVVEFTKEGEVVNQWKILDMLDPHRIKYENLSLEKGIDWTHGNSVFYDERDNSITVSFRHQDWIINFDRATGKLLWKFGEDGDFIMEGDGEWPFHQHSAKILADGSLLMYDNGNNRSGLKSSNNFYSRAVQYKLDTSDSNALSTTQLWEFRDTEKYYSPFLGETDQLANGNFLIADGGRVDNPELNIEHVENKKWARIVEVTNDSPAEKVFELIIREDDSDVGYAVYRSEKLANLVLANLGTNLSFTNPKQIPTNMELTELLPTIDNKIGQPSSVDLSVNIFADKKISLLETINKLPTLDSQDLLLNQDLVQGYLKVDIGNTRFIAQPWEVTQTEDSSIVQLDTDQTVQFITPNGIKIIAQPAIQDFDALKKALLKFDLQEPVIQRNGNIKIISSDTIWYSARSDIRSLEIDINSETGLFVTTLPVFLVFEDNDSKKRQQFFYPAPADIKELQLAMQQVEFEQGLLTFQWLNKNYQGMLDYEILQGDTIEELQILPILDKNQNESGDYLLHYPNGAIQKLFGLK